MPSALSSHNVVPVKISTLATASITSVPREIRSRRKRWLEHNPDYFETASTDFELSDPLTYDLLIRQHQTASERESEGRKRGWAGTLETSLLRSEAKLAQADPSNPKYKGIKAKDLDVSGQAQRKGPNIDWTLENLDGEDQLDMESQPTLGDEKNAPVQNVAGIDTSPKARHSGQEKWHDLLAQRFIDGYDDSFDYAVVDKDESLDEEWTGQRSQEIWFEEEEDQLEGRDGETGVQDY